MEDGTNLDYLFDLRKKFTIIGLTGETSSGCSDVASFLTKGFQDGNHVRPKEIFDWFQSSPIHNAFRKHRIIYNYAKENFMPFVEIKYKHVITLFLLEYKLSDLIKFVNSDKIKDSFITCDLEHQDLINQVKFDSAFESEFEDYSKKFIGIKISQIKEKANWSDLFKYFFNSGFQKFSDKFHNILGKNSSHHDGRLTALNYHKLMQIICNNLRRTGQPYNSGSVASFEKIFTVVELINKIIKSHRDQNKETQVVINSLKNPLEIRFFKQRFSAFYSISVNREKLMGDYKAKFNSADEEVINKVIREEYTGGKDRESHKQKVAECIQLSDVHINFLSKKEAYNKNNTLFNRDSNGTSSKPNINSNLKPSSPYFSWKDQILKYIALIDHPGLVSPSPEERCMQLAFSAKHNSGCISRHVGAAITDEDYSIKAIGWNSTPSGQVPCALRNANDIIDPNPSRGDLKAFTNYELGVDNSQTTEYQNFKSVLHENFDEKVIKNGHLLKGRMPCFCFKSLKNSISEGKNQVHTRSLHAEENAFLQLTKYGGTGIKNGIMFSTASPCELCSKKAYQLGIRLIYYIDPYPGISIAHILSSGEKPIEIRLFNGAIGSAYHQLYEPFMSYKDELALLLNHKIVDKATKLEVELKVKDEEIARLKSQLNERNTLA